MSFSSAIIFGLSVTCFSLFYLSNSIVVPSGRKDFLYYANIILKLFFQQIAIVLIPTILSLGDLLLQDFGGMPVTALQVNHLAGVAWMVYYVYFAFFGMTLLFSIFQLLFGKKGDGF